MNRYQSFYSLTVEKRKFRSEANASTVLCFTEENPTTKCIPVLVVMVEPKPRSRIISESPSRTEAWAELQQVYLTNTVTHLKAIGGPAYRPSLLLVDSASGLKSTGILQILRPLDCLETASEDSSMWDLFVGI